MSCAGSAVRYSTSALTVLCAVIVMRPLVARAGIERTPHNLTATGPGQFHGSPTANLCAFCHVPHNANATRALWNHELPPETYTLYQSTTLEAQLQQPTGSSRLCLSCHDGTIALGALAQHPEPTLGKLTGATVLGTDLSDDHPISFVYDQALVALRPGLADPSTLPQPVKLDERGEVQCSSCHDPHSDRYPKFLVMDTSYSALCVACHRIPLWQESVHAMVPATARSAQPLPGLGFQTMAQNGCSSCHQSHKATHAVRLLRGATEAATCLACHGGQVAQKDLRNEFLKPSAHRIDAYAGLHDPAENPLSMARHVECVDCHNPHQSRADSIVAQLPGPLTGVSGLDLTGGYRPQANFEYEVCLKCHGVGEPPSPVAFRVDDVTNVRLTINPINSSYHPIAAVGRNPMIRGLLPGLTAASLIACTSCHDNNALLATGSSAAVSVRPGLVTAGASPGAPRGPHGSIYEPILAREYRLDGTPSTESFKLYSLCYFCHDRTILLDDSLGGFPHHLHVVTEGAACIVCHDAHGSRLNAHLINFMTSDRSGGSVVTNSASGQIVYQSFGVESGSCTLACHGDDHENRTYGNAALAPAQLKRSGVRPSAAPPGVLNGGLAPGSSKGAPAAGGTQPR